MPEITLFHRLEAAAAWAAIKLLGALPAATASRTAGSIARFIGTRLPVSNVAYKNLDLAMPELSQAERRRIVGDCWENLGATVAEFVHLGAFKPGAQAPCYSVVGWDEHVAPLLAAGRPMIVLTGHIGNWELLTPAIYSKGLNLAFLYRAASNSLVDDMISRLREGIAGRPVTMFPKGAAGARGAVGHLRAGGSLLVLPDQKLDNGIEVPFFGRPAMTAPGLASFALKFNAPVMPMRVLRLGPARLQLVCEAPLAVPHTGDKEQDVIALTKTVNQTLERWIREIPGSWLWLHRRWPKPLYKSPTKAP